MLIDFGLDIKGFNFSLISYLKKQKSVIVSFLAKSGPMACVL